MTINDTVRLFSEMRGDNSTLAVSTRYGVVEVSRLTVGQVQGLDYVEVWLAGQDEGQPQYKIFNPPVYVVDPEGDEVQELKTEDSDTPKVTDRLRYDPVMALIETVAQHGGVR